LLATAGAFLVVALVRLFPDRARPPLRFQNLILIVADTLRQDHLSSYGYERVTAPFLDNLARQAVQVNGRSASSWTRPSVATLLTGLHPQRHGATRGWLSLPAHVPYLPEILASAGWQTRGYSSIANVSSNWGFARGFETFLELFPELSTVEVGRFHNPRSPSKPHADLVTALGLELANDLEPPFFLYLHYLDPHAPYTPVGSGGNYQEEDWLEISDVKDASPTKREKLLQQLIEQYDAAIQDFDRAFARLFNELSDRGFLDKTLLVVTSDHGEGFLEHGLLAHGNSLYEEVLRVPLLFWGEGLLPRQPTGSFHHVDLVPTLLDALRVEAHQSLGLEGRSRWGEIVNSSSLTPTDQLHHLDFGGDDLVAIVRGTWKLIVYPEDPASDHSGALVFRLDGYTETVVSWDDADLGTELLSELSDLLGHQSVVGFSPVLASPDEAQLDQLRALGYLASQNGESNP